MYDFFRNLFPNQSSLIILLYGEIFFKKKLMYNYIFNVREKVLFVKLLYTDYYGTIYEG